MQRILLTLTKNRNQLCVTEHDQELACLFLFPSVVNGLAGEFCDESLFFNLWFFKINVQ